MVNETKATTNTNWVIKSLAGGSFKIQTQQQHLASMLPILAHVTLKIQKESIKILKAY